MPKYGRFSRDRKENCPIEPRTLAQVGPGAYDASKSFFTTEMCNVSQFPNIPSHSFSRKVLQTSCEVTPGPGAYTAMSDFGIYISSKANGARRRSRQVRPAV